MEKERGSELTKRVLLRNIQRQGEIRKIILPLLAIIFLFLHIFSLPDPSLILGSILVLVSFSLFFFGSVYFKKNPASTAEEIQQILIKIIFLELLAAWAGFYLFGTVISQWLIPIAFPASLFFVFYLTLTIPLLRELYRTFFYLMSWLGLTFLILLSYSPLTQALESQFTSLNLTDPSSLVSIILSGVAVFGVKIIMDSTRDQSDWWSQGLQKANRRLEEKLIGREEIVFELRRELKETKEILQIRTLAYIKEMKRLTERFQRILSQKENSRREPEKIQEAQETAQALLNILEDSEKARRQLAKEEELTATIIDNFVDGLIILNPQGIIQEVNRRMEKDFRVKERDVQGQPVEILRKYPLLAPALSLIGESGRIKIIRKQEFLAEEGITVEVSTITLESKGRSLGCLIIFRDISREKNIQKMKTEFVSIVAHQLRTPLSAIKWSLRMILDGEAGQITIQQKEWLDKTYQSNERLIVLVNDILNVSHIEEGKFLYDVQETDLGEIVEGVLEDNKEIITRQKLKVSFQKAEDFSLVRVDKEKVQLAIQNLVNNAIHYTPPEGKIRLSLRKEGDNLLLVIKDSGIGIAKADQKKVFQKFFRGRNAIKARTDGTGLGLFIAKNIIGAHHGRIWLESQLGKGTTFYLTLPQSAS